MKTIVIGGGASGMLAAYYAASNGGVMLIEKNEKLGKKLYITGKGRCNLTNASSESDFFTNVISNPKFLYSAINAFNSESVMDFFSSRGLALTVERGNRVFPASGKSSDVIKALIGALDSVRVDVKLNERVADIVLDGNNIAAIITDKGKYPCDKVILATGGISYPLTGSTGDGYGFAKAMGHSIVDLRPALTGINFDGAHDIYGKKSAINALPPLQGLSLKNVETSFCGGGVLYKEFGELVFTASGISGPAALSLSSKINRLKLSNHICKIDLKPALSEEVLDNRIIRDFEECKNKQFKNSLSKLLPTSLILFVIALSGISGDKEVNAITKTERQGLARLIKNLTFAPVSLDNIERAVVTAGGVSTKEIDPKTMRSKLINNLYFAGEIIDVDALTGGYNLQIAFATGYLSGIN